VARACRLDPFHHVVLASHAQPRCRCRVFGNGPGYTGPSKYGQKGRNAQSGCGRNEGIQENHRRVVRGKELMAMRGQIGHLPEAFSHRDLLNLMTRRDLAREI
jgi:hypothetical protein